MALASHRFALSIQESQIGKVLAEKPGIEDQVMTGPSLPFQNIRRFGERFVTKIVNRDSIVKRIDLGNEERRHVRT
jgi:hypothetical protein